MAKWWNGNVTKSETHKRLNNKKANGLEQYEMTSNVDMDRLLEKKVSKVISLFLSKKILFSYINWLNASNDYFLWVIQMKPQFQNVIQAFDDYFFSCSNFIGIASKPVALMLKHHSYKYYNTTNICYYTYIKVSGSLN